MKKFLSTFLAFTTFAFTLLPFNKTNAESETEQAKNSRDIACIFAGRQKYLEILMPYLYKLKSDGKMQEIHFWQFTKNENDIEYLESISNLHITSKNFTKYREITPKIENDNFSLDIKAKNDAHILLNNRYEIVLGGWNDTKSVIRDGIQADPICEAKTSVLKENEFVRFNFLLKNGTLKITKLNGDKTENLMGVHTDLEHIESIKIHTGYGSKGEWDYQETRNHGVKLYDTETRFGPWHWGEAYTYYLNYDFNILYKIDDDIAYLDLDRFDEFKEFIINNPHYNFVFPNLVNHAVSLYYNNKCGLIPDEIIGEAYTNKNDPIEVYDYFKDGYTAQKVHEYFLNNINKFTHNNMNPINLNGKKESICMFGILKQNYNKIFSADIQSQALKIYNDEILHTSMESFNDEVFVYNQPENVMYPRFVATHYQFGPQIKNGLDNKHLEEYKKLSEEVAK